MSTQHVLRWIGAEAFIAKPVQASPAILRFDGDDFMDRMLGLLQARPEDLPKLVARPENWRGLADPTPALPGNGEPPKSRFARLLSRNKTVKAFRREDQESASLAVRQNPASLKLFQPVHQRYYLAAAHLVCEQPGLPPRQTSAGDRSGFVIRRLFGDLEHAFIKDEDGQGRWLPIANPSTETPADEEWLPIFPMSYVPPSGGPHRPLMAGLIPVARHDQYRYAGRKQTQDRTTGKPFPAWGRADELTALARGKIIAPWQALVERAVQSTLAAKFKPTEDHFDGLASPDEIKPALVKLNNQLTEASWRLIQDLLEFLQSHLPQLAQTLDQPPPAIPTDAAGRLLKALDDIRWPTDIKTTLNGCLSSALNDLSLSNSLLNALNDMRQNTVSSELDNTENAWPAGDGWPTFAFPLVLAIETGGGTNADPKIWLPGNGIARQFELATAQDSASAQFELLLGIFSAAIKEAVDAGNSGAANPQAPFAARLAKELEQSLVSESGPPRYVLRFVHRRCDCGPLHPPVISEASMPFELAGFFDTEAPLRPIRITLPFDTTPGGLRKYAKNSGFIVSDVLCGQMKRIRRLGFGDLVLSVLPWPFHKDLDLNEMGPCEDAGTSFGMICSLSIPIITIVAFILLIVIASLLDLIFRWLPFLILCFPVPGLKGKPNG